MFYQFVQKKREEKHIEEEQTAKAQNWKLLVCYDDDDDEERSNSLKDNIISRLPPCSAITPNEPVDSLKIDLSFTPDDPMPPGIKEDDYESERDIQILEELLDNYSLSLPENESYHFDIPSSSHPPTKPPDDNTRILNIKMMGDISKQKGLEIFQPSAECPMMINEKNTPILDVPLFHFYPP
nr:hypothetical protein [Tanacetum cinerariifolium]